MELKPKGSILVTRKQLIETMQVAYSDLHQVSLPYEYLDEKFPSALKDICFTIFALGSNEYYVNIISQGAFQFQRDAFMA